MLNHRMALKRSAALCFLFLFLGWCCCPAKAMASPWADQEGYGAKTGGKLVFGLKHTLFSWMNPWAEAHDPVYETPWTGFCAGIGKSVIYTAAGAIQLITFPIPVDFPNVGLGMHIPANHQGVVVKGERKAGDASTLEPASTAPVLNAVTSAAPKEPSLPPVAAEVLKTAEAAPEKTLASQPTEPVQNTGATKNLDKVIK